jgi:MerR family transcriptional regulator/heat shock protein HspR
MSQRPAAREPIGLDPTRPVYVISVAAELVRVHPRTLRIYEYEGLICPARTRTNIRLYSENDVRRILWIRHLTQNLGVNLAGIRVLFELEERLGMRILETLYDERGPEVDDPAARDAADAEAPAPRAARNQATSTTRPTAPRAVGTIRESA